MKSIDKLHHMLLQGDAITTPDLQRLYEHYAALNKNMRELRDTKFSLMVNEIQRLEDRCYDYLQARARE